ncbi:MAG: NTP transferase domain-containing protein [Halothermotrichaceae bacterium]
MKVDVVILAGAINTGDLKEYTDVEQEALIKIAGIPMLEYVLRAVNNASNIAGIVVVGDEKELKPAINSKVDTFIASAESMTENVIRGLNSLRGSDLVLLMTSDIPLITAEIIDKYISTCLQNKNADLYYPIIPKENNEMMFPDTKRTYFNLKEGIYTGGNMVIIRPNVIDNSIPLLKEVLESRKKPWKLTKLLGLTFIIRFALGSLSINDIEKKVNKITDCKGRFMVSPYPEIGFDVDKVIDLETVSERLSTA